MTADPPSPDLTALAGSLGVMLSNTNLFNFGPELDFVATTVQKIDNTLTTLIPTLEGQQKQLATQLTDDITTLNTAVGQIALVLQGFVIAIGQVPTLLNNQEEIIAQLQKINDTLEIFQPKTVGLDPKRTITVPQLPPRKLGP